MPDRDRELDALADAIEAFAASRAPELVAEASAEATARVRSLLTDAIARRLLDRSAELLNQDAPEPAPPAPRRPSQPRPAPEPKAKPRTPPRPPEDELGCYVYGVTRASDAPDAHARLAGVDGLHPTRIVERGELAAIVSDVPLSEFGEEPLMENLNDVEWLERTARAHESVLEEALASTTVVPMRLCTIYHGEAQVREMLDREHTALSEALDRLTGKTEWGVKMIAEPGALDAALTAPDGGDEPDGELSAGAAYIDAKRREARASDEAERLAERWARDVHERVADAAAEALLNPLQSTELAGYEGDMLLNGVYLIDDRETDRFQKLVGELAHEWGERGVTVELTGPWPPYNFVKSSIEAAR